MSMAIPKTNFFENKVNISILESNEEGTGTGNLNNSEILNQSILDKSVITCLICFDKDPDSVFMECGHGGTCYECSLDLWKSTGECYLCRNKITQVLQVDIRNRYGNYLKVMSSTQMIKKQKKTKFYEEDEDN